MGAEKLKNKTARTALLGESYKLLEPKGGIKLHICFTDNLLSPLQTNSWTMI